MRKFLIAIICVLAVAPAFAAGENVATSKAFVDTNVALKQDKIPANSGTTQVLTNTGTAGTVGTKDIYNASGEYVDQKDSLIDAATMNAAVQNAINTEFKCVQYNPNDPTDCWLVDVLGTPTQSILPTGYTALEYIESTGTQYIDTGIVPNNNTGIHVKFNRQVNGDQVVVGVITSVLAKNLYINPAGGFYVPFAENYGTAYVEDAVNNFDYDVKMNYMNDRQRYVHSVSGEYNLAITKTLVTPQHTLYVFASNTSTDEAGWGFKGRVYYMEITNNQTLVQNLIPARRNSDNEVGMYDTVTNTFFTNSGTGDFVAGPVQNLYLPSGN